MKNTINNSRISICESTLCHEYLKLVSDSRIMIDVGSGSGKHCTRFLDNDWRVFAFEPDPNNYRTLDALANNFPKLLVDDRAVFMRSELNRSFYTSSLPLVIGSLNNFHPSHTCTTTVDVVSIADFCFRQKSVVSTL